VEVSHDISRKRFVNASPGDGLSRVLVQGRAIRCFVWHNGDRFPGCDTVRHIYTREVRDVPRTTTVSRTSIRGRRRSTRAASGTRAIVDQIAQLVSANEALQRENRELTDENHRLRSELTEIGSALGRLTAPRGRRGRRGSEPLVLTEAKPRRTRRPITDPEVLARRNQALAKARAARAERLAAARAASAAAAGSAQ
jgi:hypothetical protein